MPGKKGRLFLNLAAKGAKKTAEELVISTAADHTKGALASLKEPSETLSDRAWNLVQQALENTANKLSGICVHQEPLPSAPCTQVYTDYEDSIAYHYQQKAKNHLEESPIKPEGFSDEMAIFTGSVAIASVLRQPNPSPAAQSAAIAGIEAGVFGATSEQVKKTMCDVATYKASRLDYPCDTRSILPIANTYFQKAHAAAKAAETAEQER